MNPFACPHCDATIFKSAMAGSKVKARTSILVIHKSGGVEINCPSCKQGVLLPLVVDETWQLQKAVSQRLTIRREAREAKDRG